MNARASSELRPIAQSGIFNLPLAATIGVLLNAAAAFLHPLIILPLFALETKASLHTIALISVAGAASWFAAMFCASVAARLTTQQRIASITAAILSAGAIALLAYENSKPSHAGASLLHLFFVCYVVYSATRGLSRRPAARSLSKVLRGERARWASWLAVLGAGVFSIAAGLIARKTLGVSGPGFPKNFALLFGCAAAALSAAAFLMTRARESARPDEAPSLTADLSAGISNALAAPLMRRFLVYRLAMALLAGADPFFIIFAAQRLKAPLAMAGVYLAIYSAAFLVSAPLWTPLIARAGNRVALQLTAAVRIVAPLLALVLPNIVTSKIYLDHVHNPRMPFYVFAVVFGALGLAARGQSASGANYLAEIAPERHVDAYAFVANLTVLAAGFTPLIAVRIIERDGYQRLFLATAIAGLIAVFASGLLGETRVRIRAAARTLHPRGVRSS